MSKLIQFIKYFLLLFLIYGRLEAVNTLQEHLKAHIRWPIEGTSAVGHIAINDRAASIDQSTWLYVKSALDHYKNTKPLFIILELNTPGGAVYSAQLISDALHEIDIQHGIPVVAYIDDWAMSAGAMIAYSCRFIAVAKDASMGAAEPVLQGPKGVETASEKINSAVRADFRSRAAYYDRNPLIAEGMVDKELVLVVRDGSVKKLGTDEEILPSDKVLSRRGKLLTLDAQQLMELGVADILLPPAALPALTAEEKSTSAWAATKEALFQDPFFQAHATNTTIHGYQMDWRMRFLAWIATPAISSLILMGLVIGIYMEMSHPGLGVPATVALLCLVLIVISSYAFEAAGWLEIILLFVGLVLVLLEFFILPGFGVPGVLGVLMAVAGLFLLMLPGIGSVSFDTESHTWNAAGQVFMERLSWFSASLFLALLLMALLGKYVLPRFGVYSRLVLQGEQDSSQGFVASNFTKEAIGKPGVALTDLKPSGYALIEGTRFQVLSESGYLTAGTEIFVIRGQGAHLVVQPKET